MINWLITKGLKWVWDKFDGKKTIAGFLNFFALGVLGIIRLVAPDLGQQIPQDVDNILKNFGMAFGSIGIGHKVQKLMKP
jgi:hypothetical protein